MSQKQNHVIKKHWDKVLPTAAAALLPEKMLHGHRPQGPPRRAQKLHQKYIYIVTFLKNEHKEKMIQRCNANGWSIGVPPLVLAPGEACLGRQMQATRSGAELSELNCCTKNILLQLADQGFSYGTRKGYTHCGIVWESPCCFISLNRKQKTERIQSILNLALIELN